MTESTTPLGCGPEGAVSDHADLLNALEDMAGSYAYAVRKPVLREAGRTIMALERKCNELREEMERDGVAVEAENGALHDALTERDAARQSLSESVSTEAAWMEKVAVARNERDAAVRALKGLCAWHDHPSLTGYPYGTAIPAPVPSFNAVVDAVHAVIGQPPYKPEDMPEDD